MIYVVIQDSNNQTKSYNLTDQATPPYLPILTNSFLPLTFNTRNTFELRVADGNSTYRALEYGTSSTSETFYSSKQDSAGLSSTTALTRSSTSATEYLTRSSTSNTRYLTQSSTSATSYLTRSSTSGESYLTALGTNITESYSLTGSERWYYQNVYRYMTSNHWGQGIYKSTYPYGNGAAATLTITFGTSTFSQYAYDQGGYQHLYYYHNITYRNPTIACHTASETRYQTYETNSPYSHYTTSSVITLNLYSRSEYSYIWKQLASTLLPDVVTYITMSTRYYNDNNGVTAYSSTYQRSYELLTTGTSYLTRSSTSSTVYYTRSSTYSTIYDTCSSTYSTVYQTRSSTSGYSGVSSSSQSTTTWN